MEARATFLGHAVHPMLIVFPLGLLATAVAFDVIYLVGDNERFAIASAFAIAAGIIGGLAAAVFGWVDWFAIPGGTRAKRLGLFHGLGNAGVLALFAVSFILRVGEGAWEPDGAALWLSFGGAALAIITAWMGGELVERLGVSVEENAGLNASSSLSRGARRERKERVGRRFGARRPVPQ